MKGACVGVCRWALVDWAPRAGLWVPDKNGGVEEDTLSEASLRTRWMVCWSGLRICRSERGVSAPPSHLSR